MFHYASERIFKTPIGLSLTKFPLPQTLNRGIFFKCFDLQLSLTAAAVLREVVELLECSTLKESKIYQVST